MRVDAWLVMGVIVVEEALTLYMHTAQTHSNLGKLPIVGRVPLPGAERRVWLYTGLGGRGMIHHAYLGG